MQASCREAAKPLDYSGDTEDNLGSVVLNSGLGNFIQDSREAVITEVELRGAEVKCEI